MAVEQIGEEYLIGLGSAVYSATVDPDSADIGEAADEETVPDDQGDTKSVTIKNKRKTLSLNVLVLSTGTFNPPRVGAIVSVTPPGGSATNYRITGTPRITASKGTKARLAVDLIREDSMASVYDA